MARQSTDALQYYPEETKESDSEQYIESIHGAMGYMVLRKLRKHIYGCNGGYFAQWSDINKHLFCNKNNVTINELNAVLESCFIPEIDLFDKSMYEKHKILTSSGIQKRWKKIVTESGRKNTLILSDYNLITTEENTEPLLLPIPLQDDKNTIKGGLQVVNGGGLVPESTQSKVKEIKVKESKEELCTTPQGAAAELSPKKPSVDEKKQSRKPPPILKAVIDCFYAKTKAIWDPGYSQIEALAFFNFYDANGWKQGKNKPIVKWEAAANGWILRKRQEISEKAQFKPQQKPPQPSAPAPPMSEKPKVNTDKKYEFINSIYTEYCEGTVKEDGLPPDIYKELAKMIGYTRQELDDIFNDAAQDERAARQKGLAMYFDKLKKEGVKAVFEKE